MRKIFMLCLAGVLALAASCDDDDKDGGSTSGKMTVAGRTESVKSAFYMRGSGTFVLGLLHDAELPSEDTEPEFGIEIDASETILGKTLDLTKPLDDNVFLDLYGYNGSTEIGIGYSYGEIEFYTGTAALSVTSGTMYVARSGNIFTVDFSVTLSDGNSLSARWKGSATPLQIPI